MLFTESQLQRDADPFAILDEATYLTEEEATIQPQMVSIVENNRLQAYVVDFNGIYQLAESANIDYLDAAVLVLEQEGIDPSAACFAIDEARLIESPELAQLGSIVVRPLSEDDYEFELCLEAIDAYLDTNDDEWLDCILTEDSGHKRKVNLQRAEKFSHTAQEVQDSAQAKLHALADRIRIRQAEEDASRSPEQKAMEKSLMDRFFGSGDSSSKKKSEMPRNGAPESSSFLGTLSQKLTGSSDNSSNASSSPKHSRIFSKISGIGHKVKKTVNDVVEKAAETSTASSQQNPPESKNPISSTVGNIVTSITGDKAEKAGMGLGKKIAIGAGIGGALAGGLLAYRHYKDQPKSAIAKRIAALRNIYSKFMQRAQSAPNDGIKNRLKHVAAKILRVVDKLLAFLQRKADHR